MSNFLNKGISTSVGILIILLVVIVLGGGIYIWQRDLITERTSDKNEPSIWIKKDIISNFENAKYLRVNSDILINFDQKSQESFTLAELDYVNNKAQIHSFFTLNGVENRLDYYREGDIIYNNFNGTWQKEKTTTLGGLLGHSIDAVDRLRVINKITYVKTEKLNGADSFC